MVLGARIVSCGQKGPANQPEDLHISTECKSALGMGKSLPYSGNSLNSEKSKGAATFIPVRPGFPSPLAFPTQTPTQ